MNNMVADEPVAAVGGGNKQVMKPRKKKAAPKKQKNCAPRRAARAASPRRAQVSEWKRTTQTVFYKGETLKKWINRVTGESAVRRAKVSADGTRKYIFRRV